MNLVIIAPDEASGVSFSESFNNLNVKYTIYFPKIAPRVLGEDINNDPKVTQDFQKAVDFAISHGASEIVIACNTLQHWVKKISSKVPIYTTFDAVKHEFPDSKTRPLWLGTTPCVKNIDPDDFKTLPALGRDDLQKISQEITWRVKAVTGADISTAFPIDNISSRQQLGLVVDRFCGELIKNDIQKVVLGCTEYPIAWKLLSSDLKKELVSINPADSLARFVIDKTG